MANEADRVTISFRCPKALADALEEAKWTQRKSKAKIIIEALEYYLIKGDEPPEQ
jgi:predicted DNA-binding protein